MLSNVYTVLMESAKAPEDALSRFSMGIFDVNGLLMRCGDRVARALGQSSARWQVLGRAGHRPHTVSRMARDMGHARQSVQRIADALVEEGLAVFRDNPGDRRAKLLGLTAKGAKVLNAIYARNETWSRGLMENLDPRQLNAMADSLDGIARIIRAELDRDSAEADENA